MTPDAPLIAAWAATLYYMERALLADRNWAWLGMGIAFGLGILSKYTLGLLGPAALLFVILDPASRRWLRRPHPYLAAALALLLFSPVIIWNFQHDWASILISITAGYGNRQPIFVAMVVSPYVAGFNAHRHVGCGLAAPVKMGADNPHMRRRRLFIRVFTVVPLAAFFWLSLFGAPKFHWTAPVWLAVLPTMAWMMGQTGNRASLANRVRAAWKPTIGVCLFLYALALHYVVLAYPGFHTRFSI